MGRLDGAKIRKVLQTTPYRREPSSSLWRSSAIASGECAYRLHKSGRDWIMALRANGISNARTIGCYVHYSTVEIPFYNYLALLCFLINVSIFIATLDTAMRAYRYSPSICVLGEKSNRKL